VNDIVTYRGLRVTYKTGFGLDDCIYCTLYIHNSGLQAVQRYRYSRHFQFTARHSVGLSVFPSRTPTTDFTTVSLSLQPTHQVFLAQSNSLQCLLYHLGLPSPELDPVLIIAAWVRRYIALRRNPRKACLQLRCLAIDVVLLRARVLRDVFTDPLPSNGYTRHIVY
jgi:hypothetical protein